jgi:tetratricopeptide (TPR) repeat protein
LWEWVSLHSAENNGQISPYDLLSLSLSVSEPSDEHRKWYLNELKKHPHSYKLLFGLGNLDYNQKHFKSAMELYKKVKTMQPDRYEADLKIAMIYCLKWSQ